MSNCAIAAEPFPFMAEQTHQRSEQNEQKNGVARKSWFELFDSGVMCC